MTSRTVLHLLAAGAVIACASSKRPSEAAPSASESRAATGDTLRIPIGEARTTADGAVTLTFLAALSDSRCPANVVCVWEGDAAVRVRAATRGGTRDADLHTRLEPRELTLTDYIVTLVGLEPYPGTPEETRPKVALIRVAPR